MDVDTIWCLMGPSSPPSTAPNFAKRNGSHLRIGIDRRLMVGGACGGDDGDTFWDNRSVAQGDVLRCLAEKDRSGGGATEYYQLGDR